MIANELRGVYYEISSADGYEDIKRIFRESVTCHLQSRFTDRDRQAKGIGLKKLKEGLMVRTKLLYRKRGMTF